MTNTGKYLILVVLVGIFIAIGQNCVLKENEEIKKVEEIESTNITPFKVTDNNCHMSTMLLEYKEILELNYNSDIKIALIETIIDKYSYTKPEELKDPEMAQFLTDVRTGQYLQEVIVPNGEGGLK